MAYWSWTIIFSLIAMVWMMIRYHVDPLIILALLVCVSLFIIAAVFIADSANDETKARIIQLEADTAKFEAKLEQCEKRVRDIESL